MKYAFVFLTLTSIVKGECPGGCSTNGVCGPRDMCTCFKNFMGNDCSQRVCPFGKAHVDTPKGDINMDRSSSTAGLILTNSQMYPGGTWEYNNPNALPDEGHFYMECSNAGLCDRSTGLCQCFPGFEGSSCQRAACNNACNQHGVCKSIGFIASNGDRSLSITGNPKDKVSTTYDLWDAEKTMGCICDPWFEGPDCSRRSCKVGVDPLYEAAGYPIYETFNIYAAIVPTATKTIDPTTSWIQLRVYDYYGESYLTERITVMDDTAAGVNSGTILQNALKALPNGIFSSVTCWESTDANTPSLMPKLATEVGFFATCQFNDNPGRMRLPDVYAYQFGDTSPKLLTSGIRAFITANNRRGEDVDYCATPSIYTVAATVTTGTAFTVATTTLPVPAALQSIAVGTVVKVKDRLFIVDTVSTNTGFSVKWDVAGSLTAGSTIYYATGLTAAADTTCTVTAWAVGSNSFTCNAAPTTLAVGSMFLFHNAIFIVRGISGGTTVTVDRNFNGNAAAGAAIAAAENLYILTPASPLTGSYQYVSKCSGRGICDFSTGICQCFKGYTDDNCDTQNILAF
ncbi:hypothetical protein THRCLA_01679 [Thraustotheca clavata]|uniref:Secreted protein n=1 Tax=Thraustotheca clavata TaxID=74557 RepID=A0A0A7CLW6_9STRA|nr:secreted protein [Thraustotheca clavata]OQS06265.1 hypothetical protein THRCLA_01679 [Thraustotheca clavata]